MSSLPFLLASTRMFFFYFSCPVDLSVIFISDHAQSHCWFLNKLSSICVCLKANHLWKKNCDGAFHLHMLKSAECYVSIYAEGRNKYICLYLASKHTVLLASFLIQNVAKNRNMIRFSTFGLIEYVFYLTGYSPIFFLCIAWGLTNTYKSSIFNQGFYLEALVYV